MKHAFRAIAGAAVLLIASAAAAETVSNDAFSVTLPAGFGAFTKQSQTVTGNDGKIETTNWISRAPSGEAVVITVSKMPGRILNPDQMINGTRDGLLKELHATVDNEQPLSGDGHSKLITFHSAGAWLTSRLTVDNDMLYQLLYVGRTADQRSAAAVNDMFHSFRVDAPAEQQASAK